MGNICYFFPTTEESQISVIHLAIIKGFIDPQKSGSSKAVKLGKEGQKYFDSHDYDGDDDDDVDEVDVDDWWWRIIDHDDADEDDHEDIDDE